MKFLNEYLNKLNLNMKELLSGYIVVKYSKEEDIEKGLLRFKEPPKGRAFLFQFSNEEIREFHSVGMKFPIDIYFFDKNENMVQSYKNVKPGIEIISSKKPCKYVVEIPN